MDPKKKKRKKKMAQRWLMVKEKNKVSSRNDVSGSTSRNPVTALLLKRGRDKP